MSPVRAAFLMEQTLGHVTHYQNLRAVAGRDGAVDPTWVPLPFAPTKVSRLVPLLGTNWSVRASWRARRALSRLAPGAVDALFFHTQVTALFSLPYLRRVPSIVSLDATPINFDRVGHHYGHRPAGDGPIDRAKQRLNRAVFAAAHRLITWSNWARDSLVHDYGVPLARIDVLAPGAAPEYFEIGRRRSADGGARSPGPLRLLFVGGDFARKGGSLLLDLARGPLRGRCELHLVTRHAIEPEPGVSVHRDVPPNSPRLLRLFADADVFVLPSLAECLSVALMEAAAAALPIVTTDVGALAEALVPGETGLLVPSGDGPALARAVEAIAGDAGRRVRMGRAGHELARRKFDADANDRALLRIVRDAGLAASRGRAA